MAVYATVDQLTIRMQFLTTPTVEQRALMGEILEGVSKHIDNACRTKDGFLAAGTATARYYSADGKAHLRIHKCVEVSEVAVRSSCSATTFTVWDAPTTPMAGDGDYVVCSGDPERPVFGIVPYDLLMVDINGSYSVFLNGSGIPTVRVTARWGAYAAVPYDIREATLMQAIRWYKKEQASMAQRSASEDLGQITYRRQLDGDVKQILVDGGYITPLYGGAE